MNLTTTIIEQAAERGKDKTICPSEIARELWPDSWRDHMAEVRKAAFALRDNGRVIITQKGQIVTGDDPVGPIRIKIVEGLNSKKGLERFLPIDAFLF